MTQYRKVYRKRKKIRKKRPAVFRRIFIFVCMAAVLVSVLRTAGNFLRTFLSGTENLRTAAVSTERPVVRKGSGLYYDLEQYAALHPAAAKIYENKDIYPEKLIAAYLNNPEMEDFITGYPDAVPGSAQSLSPEEAGSRFPLLLQWDKRWGYNSYGESIIGLSGCGPSCLSMVLVTLLNDASMTPDQVAQFSESQGYYVSGSGTSWSLMTHGAAALGLTARELPLDESVIKNALDAGEPVICSMGAGDFTTEGHFILIYDYDEQGFILNDPNCISRSGRTWTYDELSGQIKNLWAYRR